VTWLLFAVMFGTLAIGVPVAFSLGLASVAYLVVEKGIPLIMMPQRVFAGLDNFVLLCIPGFVLAGSLMGYGGITIRIVRFCNALVGHIRGGLAQANVVACMIFAGISGTAAADAASVGGVMIPAMKKAGYDARFASALTAAASTTGPLIPPSLPMVIAGTMVGLSVGKLFVAGAIPGLLVGFSLMGMAYYYSVKRGYPKGERTTLKELWTSFVEAIWAILLTLIILGGIVFGIFTPTEAAFIGVFYSLIVGLFVYKELELSDLPKIFLESAVATVGIMMLVGFANIFAWIMASDQIPQQVADAMLSVSREQWVILLMVNILLLFVGTFMETIASLIILYPVLYAVATAVGIDPIHFTMIAVLNLVLGLLTPPVGVCLFIASGIGKISLVEICKEIWPMLIVLLGVLGLVTYVPQITLFLPNLMYGVK
jgi:C4-dicarboxylate transporter DctM subunit